MNNVNDRLIAFLNKIHSPYHTVEVLRETLLAEGYRELRECDEWAGLPGGKWFVTRGGSSLLAFRLPEKFPSSLMMAAAHSDFPAFRVKPNHALVRGGGARGLSVESYGGMLLAPWMDRPLSVAGRVTVKTECGVKTVPVDIPRDLFIIPSVAIHMNREANKNASYNPAVDMVPLAGCPGGIDRLLSLLAEAAGCQADDVLAHDLFLYPRMPAMLLGDNEDLVCGQHLDDLQCVFSLTEGFLRAKDADDTLPLLAIFDNEEVGSSTKQGANSTFLSSVLARIAEGYGLGATAVDRLLSSGMMVSADNAHAVHPNHPEYADPNHAPRLGGGVVIKHNASQKYTTDAISDALFSSICQSADVPVQHYANRADLPGGSTLGSISNTRVSLPTVDIGLAQLSMHSCYETGAAKDTESLVSAMTAFFGTRLAGTDGNYTLAFGEVDR